MSKTKRKPKKNFSIRTKLIISYFLLSFFITLVFSFFNYNNSSHHLKSEKLLLYSNSAEGICKNIENQLHNYSAYSMTISSNATVQKYLYNPPDDIKKQFDIVTTTIEPLVENFKVLNPLILDLNFFVVTNKNMIHSDYIRYIDPKKNEIDNTYRAEYPWKYNGNFVQQTSIFNTDVYPSNAVGYLEIVLDAQGILESAVSADKSGFLVNVYTDEKNLVWSNFETSKNSAKKNSHTVFVESIPIVNTSLTVDFYIPNKQIYAGVITSAIANTLVLLLISFAIFSIFISLYSHMIAEKIKTLTGIIDNIDQSNLEIDINMQQNDEIGVLTQCLNGMLKRINLLISDIYQAKEAEKQAELNALRSQINPHFLYNSMDMINWMAIGNDADKICHVTGLISQYYRTMLNHGNHFATIENELNNIKSYIDIQLIMHNYSFDVEYELDDKLLPMNTLNFILQPAIENALKHGIDPINNRRGLLRIVVKEGDGCILINICDNGMGITEEQQILLNEMLASDSKNSGYGLRNVQERIQLAFGKEYGLTLSGKTGEGCTTKFRLPLFNNKENYIKTDNQYNLLK